MQKNKSNRKTSKKSNSISKKLKTAKVKTSLPRRMETNKDKQKETKTILIPFGRYVVYTIITNLLLISLIFIFISTEKLPPQVPLFYGLPESEEQLVSRAMLALPSFFSIATIILNSILSVAVQEEFLKKTLILSSFLITLFSLITTLKIFFLVGSI